MPTAPRRLRSVLLTLAVWMGVVSVFVLQRIVGDVFRDGHIRWTTSVGMEVVYWIPWLVLAPLLVALARRFPFTTDGWRRSLAVHLGAGLVLAVIEAGASTAAERFAVTTWWPLPPGRMLPPFGPNWAVYSVIALWKYWAFIGIMNAFAASRRSREREVHAARLEAQLTNARLQTLQSRLHPHFLFNALHSASMLTLVDAEAANQVLARLADLLRDALRAPETTDVSLARELELVQRYLELERIRFADRLSVQVTVDPAVLGARVPALLLQPLVENAIRHGVAAVSTAGRVAIRGHRAGGDLVLEVEDDGPGPPADWSLERGTGLGLGTTAARLRLLFPGAHRLELSRPATGGCLALVALPCRFA